MTQKAENYYIDCKVIKPSDEHGLSFLRIFQITSWITQQYFGELFFWLHLILILW